MDKPTGHSEKSRNSSKAWITTAMGAILLPVVGWFTLETFLGDMENEATTRLVARLLIVVSLLCIAVAGFSAFKVKGLCKLVPIVAILLGLVVGFFAFVAHQLSYIG